MEEVWIWILAVAVAVSIITIFNIVGFSYGVDCCNRNNYSTGKAYMSTLLGVNVLLLVISILTGVYWIVH